MKSARPQDMVAESVVAQYLDRYFYPVVMPAASCDWVRVCDRESQLQGVDVRVALSGGRVLNVDEKAQVDYLKDPLPTFVLELGFIAANGEHRPGWFVNDELLTDLYLFVWPRADVDKRNLGVDDIASCECMTVPKARLRAMMERRGWSAENLMKLGRLIRDQRDCPAGSRPLMQWDGVRDLDGVQDVPGVKAHRSNRLSEDPVNLVVAKKTLAQCATGHYCVRPSSVEVLKAPDTLDGVR